MRTVAGGIAALALAAALSAQQRDVDAAFERFLAAKTPADAAKLVDEIVRSGVTADEAYQRLRVGRTYTTQPRNLVELTHETAYGAYPFAANIPQDYEPSRKSPAVLFLHGGVGREQSSVQASLSQASAFAEALPDHVFIVPQAWREAQWWTERQTVNVNGIVDTLKRLYNIDENRVSVLGLSDGGTGAYYFAMRDGSRFASFVPMLGMALVLANERMGIEGVMFPNNLRNKPFFVVNGARDIQYPIDRVNMYIERFKAGGVDIDYRPQADAGHDRTWWPQMKAPVEAFLRDHPRTPLPDRLTWQTSSTDAHNRASWLVIDALGRAEGESTTLDDVNLLHGEPMLDFGVRAIGARIAFIIKGSNAEQIGLQPFDWLLELNGAAVKVTTDLDLLFAQVKPGTEIEMLVARKELPVEIKGVYAPKLMTPPPEEMFPRGASGRVDLVRSGNTIEATTSGVTAFTLLLSPDQFDFTQPVKVVANGKTVFEGRVEKSLATLMRWAGADNDRSMLFGAELRIDLTK